VPEWFDLNKVDIWFEDESRVGQKGTLTRIWAKKGKRPRVIKQQQYINTYIIGSVCPNKNIAEAIISPYCNSDAIHHHLQQISAATTSDHFAVVVMDQAGWHITPKIDNIPNVALLFLPAYSPELNPMEQVWEWLKSHFLHNRIFNGYDDIEKSCCDAWNAFSKSKDLFQSMCNPSWAKMAV
jgi:hypothetical protein